MGEMCYGDLRIEVGARGVSRRLNRRIDVAVLRSRIVAEAAAVVIPAAVAVLVVNSSSISARSDGGRSGLATAGWQVGPCRFMAWDPGSASVGLAAHAADASVQRPR